MKLNEIQHFHILKPDFNYAGERKKHIFQLFLKKKGIYLATKH